MQFETFGSKDAPAVLFFHAMGVTGASSEPVARYLQEKYFCILPTSTVYCEGQKYAGKADEIRQVGDVLDIAGRHASCARRGLVHRRGPRGDVFVADENPRRPRAFRRRTVCADQPRHTPRDGAVLYLAIKSLYWSKGGTLKKIMWCDDDAIKPYFIAAGKALTYGNMRRQMADSLEDKPFPPLSKEVQEHCFFEFGSGEEHFKYREAVRKAYPDSRFPVFEGHDHMQYQIRDPQGFAAMLEHIIEQNELPPLPFLRK